MAPTRRIVVIGPVSAGNRLLTRILREIPDPTFHTKLDASHGQRRPMVRGDEFTPIVIRRDPKVVDASRERRATEERRRRLVPREVSEAGIAEMYPDAFVVQYEDLVSDRDAVIAALAEHLGIEPWESTVDVFDGNARAARRAAR